MWFGGCLCRNCEELFSINQISLILKIGLHWIELMSVARFLYKEQGMLNIRKVALLSGLLLLASFLKLSFSQVKLLHVAGSRSFYFSAFCIMAPLLGRFVGLRGAGLVFLITKLLRFLIFGSLFCITGGIPSLLAAASWSLKAKESQRNKIFSFGLTVLFPLVCLALFVIHPSVQAGWWYGLYWLIPVLLYLGVGFGVLSQSLFVTALQSTFIAHAAGSLLWCYLVPTSPEGWLALIPVVAAERLVFASGMVLVVRLAQLGKVSALLPAKRALNV